VVGCERLLHFFPPCPLGRRFLVQNRRSKTTRIGTEGCEASSFSVFLCGAFSKEEPVANQNTERWMHLCEQASTEHDSAKLMSLVTEINAILDDQVNGHEKDGKSLKHQKSKQRSESLRRNLPTAEDLDVIAAEQKIALLTRGIEAETQERIASSNESIRQSHQLIEDTLRIVREHRK